jgi:hypothetical protein
MRTKCARAATNLASNITAEDLPPHVPPPGHGFTRLTRVRPLVRRTGMKATDAVIAEITSVAFVFRDIIIHTNRFCEGTHPSPSCAILPSCLSGDTRERTELMVV